MTQWAAAASLIGEKTDQHVIDEQQRIFLAQRAANDAALEDKENHTLQMMLQMMPDNLKEKLKKQLE